MVVEVCVVQVVRWCGVMAPGQSAARCKARVCAPARRSKECATQRQAGSARAVGKGAAGAVASGSGWGGGSAWQERIG